MRRERAMHYMTPIPGEALCGRTIQRAMATPDHRFVTCAFCLRLMAADSWQKPASDKADKSSEAK